MGVPRHPQRLLVGHRGDGNLAVAAIELRELLDDLVQMVPALVVRSHVAPWLAARRASQSFADYRQVYLCYLGDKRSADLHRPAIAILLRGIPRRSGGSFSREDRS